MNEDSQISQAARQIALQPENLTDDENGRRFAREWAHVARFCAPMAKWLVFVGTHWPIDDRRKIQELAKQSNDRLWEAILPRIPHEGSKRAAELIAFGKYSASVRGTNNALAKASSEDSVVIMPADLDRDPLALNVRNGTIDLRTARLNYPTYRQQGLPITSSHIESTVKQLNRRIKGTEKFWSKGAEALTTLAGDYLSDTPTLESFWQDRPTTKPAPAPSPHRFTKCEVHPANNLSPAIEVPSPREYTRGSLPFGKRQHELAPALPPYPTRGFRLSCWQGELASEPPGNFAE